MERKSIVILIVILLVVTPLIILLYGQAVFEFFEPTVPRCTKIVVNFY